jgi:hypothetical protein
MMAEINCGQDCKQHGKQSNEGVYFTGMSTTWYGQGCRQDNTQHGLHSFAQQLPSFTIRGYSLETIPKYATEQKPAIQVTARTSPPTEPKAITVTIDSYL